MDTDVSGDIDGVQWAALSLQRLERLLALNADRVPPDLTTVQALALIEWCRMSVFGDCVAAGRVIQAVERVRRSGGAP